MRGFAAKFLIALWLGCVTATLAVAQDAVVLSGTLKKAKDTGALIVGYRESSLPFSYLNQAKRPIGYSIDICQAIVETAAAEIGRDLTIQWVPVTSENRFDAMTSGRIDLECGSTTRNAERMRIVGFSPVIFIAGTKLMVPRGSPIKSFRDLKGKTVVATAGTTNADAIEKVSARFSLDVKIIRARDHADAFEILRHGGADAYAGDDVLLYGFLAHYNMAKKFDVTRDFLSYDPYGIMLRKNDPQFAAVVDRAVRNVITSGDLERLYKQWFLSKLPTGERLDIPMSAQLEDIIQATPEQPE
ncbi:amino acid ABC transporter substrate-binding protein, PAAT family [Cupriavidus sp. YR651]|uniref:amino acid ABC transporter substrate-binding protein n=1 Tax=Cupriavidus sp. YR651 TaxID=1855315 RepID=UPI0008879267|nr:amino acid ABC transporter substrate-binding protein [Cupriavidus sp. YR651]SDD06859.1 amino acid ABC transporter substrate-binding protein, PAAT family [Cupriavidus sp. YR651]